MSDDSDTVYPSRIDVVDNMWWLTFALFCKLLFGHVLLVRMRNMRLRVLYSIGFEGHQREVLVDAKTADGRDSLCSHDRLKATFNYVHCYKKGVELLWGSLTRYHY